MSDAADLRASDGDRERIATRLREHAAEGRLDADELEERLGRAYAAKTGGELEVLTRDLPVAVDPATTSEAVARRDRRKRFQGHLATYVSTSLMLVLIWAVTGADGSFWPIWVVGFWGIAVLGDAWRVYLADEDPRHGHHHDRRRHHQHGHRERHGHQRHD